MLDYGYIGMDKEEIDTPALLIDLDVLDKNIKVMADYYDSKEGAALRPHQKGHRLPMIARKQLEAGAKGVSMTSFGLAEYYVNCGIGDILVTNEVYGKNKIARLCSLAKRSGITVGIDNIENLKQLSSAALKYNTKINVAVELYMGSAGVELGQALPFVKDIASFKGVNFKGLWWHEGFVSNILNWEKRKKAEFEVLDKIAKLAADIEDTGINVELLSGGFTCVWNIIPMYSGLNSVGVQAGNYVFCDWVDRLLEGQEVFDCALTVLTSCVSRSAVDKAVFDSGLNTCSSEAGGASRGGYTSIVGPKFKDIEGIKNIRQREEIMVVTFEDPRSEVKVGDVFEVIPPHADTTAKLHDRYYGIRNNKVEAIWPNYGRGLF